MPYDEVKRCTGHCCKLFTLPQGPEELRDMCETKPRVHESDRQIAAMVEWKGVVSKGAHVPGTAAKADQTLHLYTCKNLQPNGDCGVYETRPRMCRDYPYGGKCMFTACSRVCEFMPDLLVEKMECDSSMVTAAKS